MPNRLGPLFAVLRLRYCSVMRRREEDRWGVVMAMLAVVCAAVLVAVLVIMLR